MDHISTALILLIPGALAALWHCRMKNVRVTVRILSLWAVYAFVITWLLCFIKMLRGWGEWNISDGFSSAKSFVVYGGLALFIAWLLPVLAIRLSSVTALRWRGNLDRWVRPKEGRPHTETIEKRTECLKGSLGDAFRLDMSFARITALLSGILVLCSCLLILVCSIPDGRIDQNITISADKMTKEGKYPEWVPGSIYYRIDNWTEAALLNMIYTGSSDRPVEAAFAQKEYWAEDGGRSGLDRLNAAVNGGDETTGHFELRSTYWLGMRIFLIPLLAIADYYSLRPILLFINFILFFALALLVSNRIDMKTGMALFVSVIMLNYYTSAVQWCNGLPCLWITALAIAFLLRKSQTTTNYGYLFLVVGALTSYFDWFSVPLVTFGLPVVTAIMVMEGCAEYKPFSQYFNMIFKSGVGWCLGYGLMLMGRVVISTLVAGNSSWQNFAQRAVYNITSSGGSDQSGIYEKVDTIINGFRGIFPLSMLDIVAAKLILIALIIVVVVLAAIYCRKNPAISALTLVSLSPFVWFFIFNGYCRVHFWIAFRVFIVTVFAWICIGILLIKQFKKSTGKGGQVEKAVL